MLLLCDLYIIGKYSMFKSIGFEQFKFDLCAKGWNQSRSLDGRYSGCGHDTFNGFDHFVWNARYWWSHCRLESCCGRWTCFCTKVRTVNVNYSEVENNLFKKCESKQLRCGYHNEEHILEYTFGTIHHLDVKHHFQSKFRTTNFIVTHTITFKTSGFHIRHRSHSNQDIKFYHCHHNV